MQLHLSETTCQQMHVLSSCKSGLLLVRITAHDEYYTLIKQCFKRLKSKNQVCPKFKSAADTETEHHISALVVANGWWEEFCLTLWLQFRRAPLLLLLSNPDQSLPPVFPPKSLVCRLHEAGMGMDQCLLAPPAELISIAGSPPPTPPIPPPPLLLHLSQQELTHLSYSENTHHT